MAKKPKRQKNEKPDGKTISGLSQETKNSVLGIISVGLALISTLAFFNQAGGGGRLFAALSRQLFGWGIFLVPIALALLGVAFFKSISRRVYISAIIGTILFVLSFLGIFHIIGNGDPALRISQGGYLGLVLGFPLFKSVGFITSFVILTILLLISVLVVLDIPVYGLLAKPGAGEETEEEDLEDKVVIKRGGEIIRPSAEVAPRVGPDSSHPGRKTKSTSDSTSAAEAQFRHGDEFVIKHSKSGRWVLPPLEILHTDKETPRAGDINANVAIIKRTLSNFGIDVEMGEVSIGPTVTQFTLRPAMGIKLSRITVLNSDLALALAAHPIRIEAPIPGKALVGIEVPNKKSALVGLRDLFEAEEFKSAANYLPVVLGRDVAGFPVFSALEKMPHLLIAGATGTGKSVAINTVLLSLLYKHSPDTLKLILVDPKRVELTLYNGIPHLITPVIVDAKKVVNALRWAVREMEKRYERLSAVSSRDVASFNIKQIAGKREIMPYIIIVIDELADLMAAHGRDVEAAVVRLAQMARAVGIHLIVSTQRPSTDVITGLIKANITTRIAFQVASQVDSRTILDMAGAEKLLGNGDMLYQAGDTSKPRRIQGAFVSEKEVKDVAKFIKQQAEEMEETAAEEEEVKDVFKLDFDQAVSATLAEVDDIGDELYEEAKQVVAQAGKASASLLQRRLRVGYARAARLLDLLEERGIIGPGEGAKPREVFIGRPETNLGPSRELDDGTVARVVAVDSATGNSPNSRLDDEITAEG